MLKDNALTELLQGALAVYGYELWGYELNSFEGNRRLQVYIETPQGVSVDDCERASRQIGAVLDVEDPLEGKYLLEVSSPGLTRSLYTAAQYQRYVGQALKIRTAVGGEGRRTYQGELTHVTNEAVSLVVEGETVILPFSEIEKANLVF
jgi:ribosome maturation factor RimP